MLLVGLSDKLLEKVYRHNLETDWGPRLPASILDNLKRTPPFISIQQGLWLTHCQDFMVYIGTWEIKDFDRRAPDGNGRTLFEAMTGPEQQFIWDDFSEDCKLLPAKRYIRYYAFECQHCYQFRGYWDCD